MKRLFRPKRLPATRATLISCLKDEGPYLIEWLAYHKAIGFDRFVIGANNCTDGSHEMLTRLAELGEVEYVPLGQLDGSVGAQEVFSERLTALNIATNGEWIAWLDLDEFLNIHLGKGHVDDLLTALRDLDGIRIPWRMFGATEVPAWPGRQLHPDLCRCSPEGFVLGGGYLDQRTIKSVYRYQHPMRFGVHGPIMGWRNVVFQPDWVDGSGEPLRPADGARRKLQLRAGRTASRLRTTPTYGWAQINHYFMRHPSLVPLRQKRGRGAIYVPAEGENLDVADFAERHSDAYVARHNRTDAEDRSILRHLPDVDREMARLLADPIVRQWHDHAHAQIADFLAAREAAADQA